MVPPTIETREDLREPTVGDRLTDARRHAMHMSHDARLLKSAASDAIEEGVHAARRAVRRRVRQMEDFRDEAIRRVRRQPFPAMGAALGVGLVAGVMLGLALGRFGRRD